MNDDIKRIEHHGFTIRIVHDHDPMNPREWDNFGTMACAHGRYELGDNDGLERLVAAVTASRDYKQSWDDNTDWSHLPDVNARALECSDIVCLPLFLYDHSGITMNTRGFSCPWDSGQVGVTFATRAEILENWGGKVLTQERIAKARDLLRAEVETYDAYLTGQVYGFVVEDAEGEHCDSCYGFYDLDDVMGEAKGIAEYLEAESLPLLAHAGIIPDAE